MTSCDMQTMNEVVKTQHRQRVRMAPNRPLGKRLGGLKELLARAIKPRSSVEDNFFTCKSS